MLKNVHLTPKYGGNTLQKYTKPRYFAYTHYEIKMVAPGLIKKLFMEVELKLGTIRRHLK